MPKQLCQAKETIEGHKQDLFYFMLFARLTPILPNWSINLFSSLVDVPFIHFFFGTLFGLMPANLMLCTIGASLGEMSKVGLDTKV